MYFFLPISFLVINWSWFCFEDFPDLVWGQNGNGSILYCWKHCSYLNCQNDNVTAIMCNYTWKQYISQLCMVDLFKKNVFMSVPVWTAVKTGNTWATASPSTDWWWRHPESQVLWQMCCGSKWYIPWKSCWWKEGSFYWLTGKGQGGGTAPPGFQRWSDISCAEIKTRPINGGNRDQRPSCDIDRRGKKKWRSSLIDEGNGGIKFDILQSLSWFPSFTEHIYSYM